MSLALPEALANLGSTTLTSSYTSGGTSIAVASVSGMPASNIFHVLVADQTTKLVKAIFKVTAISSLTLTTTAEVDANCASGDYVLFTGLSAGAIKQLLADQITEGVFSGAYAATGFGRLWLPTDSPIIQHDNGSGLSHYGPICAPFTDATGVSFTQLNFGVNTTQTNAGGRVILDESPPPTSDNIRGLEITAPSTPYSITVALIADLCPTNYMACGLYFRDHSAGKLVTFMYGNNTGTNVQIPTFSTQKWASPTSFSAAYSSAGGYFGGTLPLCGVAQLRVRDDEQFPFLLFC